MEATSVSIPGLIALYAPTAHRSPWILQPHVRCRGCAPGRNRSGGVRPRQHVALRERGRPRTACPVGAGENKLVRCSAGAIFDVVVDLRPSSPTFRRWLSFDLDGDNQRSLYIPAGCAHGFQALTEPADTSYRIDREHDPSEDLTIAYDDPELAVPWPLPVSVMSESDRMARPLRLLMDELAAIRA